MDRLSKPLEEFTTALAPGVREADVDRLLARRTRDLTLPPDLTAAFDSSTWRSRARTLRSWLYWAFCINLLLTLVDWLHLPQLLVASFLVRGLFLSAICLGMIWLWRKPRQNWVEGISVVIAGTCFIGAGALLGAIAGGAVNERYVSGAMLVPVTLILSARVHWPWVVATYATSLTITLQASLANPIFDTMTALAITFFYAAVLGGIVMARQAMFQLEKRAFLMKIKSQFDEQKLLTFATTDTLTRCRNRLYFESILGDTWLQARRSDAWLAVILVDVDHFKQVNDSFGHAAGDRCLIVVAQTIQAKLRQMDVVARFGGEEFIVLARGADPDAAVIVAERIRAAIEAVPMDTLGIQRSAALTVSLGVAALQPSQSEIQPHDLIERADRALYAAKTNGRNRVEFDVSHAVDALRTLSRQDPEMMDMRQG